MRKQHKCFVKGCSAAARFKVFLHDVYLFPNEMPDLFLEQDFTCPYLCMKHMIENENGARYTDNPANAATNRLHRGFIRYPYTNQNRAQGYTVYEDLGE